MLHQTESACVIAAVAAILVLLMQRRTLHDPLAPPDTTCGSARASYPAKDEKKDKKNKDIYNYGKQIQNYEVEVDSGLKNQAGGKGALHLICRSYDSQPKKLKGCGFGIYEPDITE